MRIYAWIADRPTWLISLVASVVLAALAAVAVLLLVVAPSIVTLINAAVVWAAWAVVRSALRDLTENDMLEVVPVTQPGAGG